VRILRATIVGLLAVAAFPGSAFAAPANQANVRQEVSTFVAQHPGAKQISGDTVQAGEGHFITFSTAASRTNAQAQASCPSNAYCWFEHAYYGGSNVLPPDIVMRKTAKSAKAAPLLTEVANAAK